MIYILLFLHFGFNVFFTMCFAAFVFASTHKKYIERLAILYLFIYSMIEIGGLCFLLINGDISMVWFVWMAAVFVACIISLAFYFCRKLDIVIWGPFSVIFGPLIIVPVLVFLLVLNMIEKKQNKANY